MDTEPLRTALRRFDPRVRLELPRPMRERWAGLRRDVQALASAFTDQRPPPVRLRDGRAYVARTAQAAALNRRTLQIVGVDPLTPDAVRLRLARLDGAPTPFHPGQFLTLCVRVDGEEHRRAYSLCSDPTRPGELAVAVKRVEGGRVSGHLVARAEAGQRVDVLGPSGSYGVTLDAAASRHLVLVAGGSGITPHLAIAQGVLAVEPQSRVTLVYASRSATDEMFATQLDDLVEQNPDRLRLHRVHERPAPGFAGQAGRLDAAGAAAAVAALPTDAAGYFVCGPAPMMEAVTAALAAHGVSPDRVHLERFTPGPRARGAATTPQPVVIWRGGASIGTEAAPGRTLLEAGLAAGVAMPYSCAMGGCGACRVRLTAGDVVMDEPNCLTDRERAEGHVLACVARAAGPVQIEVPR
ncbi:MAG: ferredoxin--NADP reductase [Myxococcales bacterium]|nr:ferredoxin--NADP reductase [Myxococcales bacterium]